MKIRQNSEKKVRSRVNERSPGGPPPGAVLLWYGNRETGTEQRRSVLKLGSTETRDKQEKGMIKNKRRRF